MLCLLLTAQPGCGSCSPHPQGGSTAPDAHSELSASGLLSDGGDLDELDPPFGSPSSDSQGAVIFELVGRPDALNRYSTAVMVRAQSPTGEARLRECGGVIIAPRLILTAGHCVCRRQAPTLEGVLEYRMDATACAGTAMVTVFFYEQDPRNPQQIIGSTSAQHRGRVRPHPALEVRLDEREALLSSQADLATILLDTPVPAGFHPAMLARTPVVPGETLTRVGFGYDETLEALDGRRLVHESKVLKALTSANGRFLLEDADGHIFRGDDGGPCFRETRSAPELVGISTTGLGQESTMTSLSPYRDWLRAELSLAASSERSRQPGAPK
jgi:hypothetical protein